ncbi:MAG: ATP-binding protein, partial [Pseudomonadota bacterium]|nr:ATP-binding protein [Pseudomonadota bacterium]
MIVRRLTTRLRYLLATYPAVALLGARQVGKTTLAHVLTADMDVLYLDLEAVDVRARLANAESYLAEHEQRLVVLDEIQNHPNLFQSLRGLIDQGRRRGRRSGRFLLLGSSSPVLLRQSSETLAGRIAYLELNPLDVQEVGLSQTDKLWLRGGFPDSFLAASDTDSIEWRENFIRTYLERDVPQLGPRINATTLRRFWTMLVHVQGSPINMAGLARSLGVDGKTVASYLDLMIDLLLVRKLPPWNRNIGKRLTKRPKVYVRDSGIAHALLNLSTKDMLLGHPIVGSSWESFVIENLLAMTRG